MSKELLETAFRLVFDSWNDRPPEIRGQQFADRHLVYEGDGVILDLLLSPTNEGGTLHVTGQLLPSNQRAFEAQLPQNMVSHIAVLIEQDRAQTSTFTNTLGEFTFPAIQNETFDLAIVLGCRRFEVQGLAHSEPRMWRVVSSITGKGE